MANYETIKAELSAKREKLTHFTKKFFNDYVNAVKTARSNLEKGIDSTYVKDGIYLNHAYDAIYASKFYQHNSGAYCCFLQVINGKI